MMDSLRTNRFGRHYASLISALLLGFIFYLAAPCANARAVHNLIRVAPEGQSTTGCGMDWDSACDLQYALEVVTNPSDGETWEIWLKGGTYYPTTDPSNRTAAFVIKPGVSLYGGFAGTETQREQRNWTQNHTVLSGDIDRNDLTSPAAAASDLVGGNSYHVLTSSGVGADTVIDGLIITAGMTPSSTSGAGMVINNGSPTLTNLVFQGNRSTLQGGGLYAASCNSVMSNILFQGNAANAGGGMTINYASSVTLNGGTFINNTAASQGGGLSVNYQSTITMDGAVFKENTGQFGGGLWAGGFAVNVTNTQFENNHSTYTGGGFYTSGSRLNITHTTFINNQADSNGGGYSGSSPNAELDDVLFQGNTAGSNGGGLSNSSSNIHLSNVTFVNNTAALHGGGMNTSSGAPLLEHVMFRGNSATGQYAAGGGLYNVFGSPILIDVVFEENTSNLSGGGMANDQDGTPVLTQVSFTRNSAKNSGGGYTSNKGIGSTLSEVTFTENTAEYGGGLAVYNTAILTDIVFESNAGTDGGGAYFASAANTTLTRLTFHQNQASVRGGGFETYGSSLTVNDSSFIQNSAASYGGGIAILDGTHVFSGVSFIQNTSESSGGGISILGGSVSVSNSTLSGNSAKVGGGIFLNPPSTLVIMNTTVFGNTASSLYGALYYSSGSATITNSILWGNTPVKVNSGIAITYSDVEGGYTGVGNQNVDPLLGAVSSHGGPTQVHPLLPGSPVIDKGSSTACLALDQRSVSRPQGTACDMGAYEARPFSIRAASGDNQSTPITAPFPVPLEVEVSGTGGDPVDGGKIIFTAPSSGPGAALANSLPVITNGIAGVTATANGLLGEYEVSASAAGTDVAHFHLTNLPIPTSVELASSLAPSMYGETIALNAVVRPAAPVTLVPTGSVTFYDDLSILGTVPLTNQGGATYSTSTLAVGVHSLIAVYNNSANFVVSQSAPFTQEVKPLPAEVTLENLEQTYNGMPRSVSVTTTPPGLIVQLTYSGSTQVPVNAGTYTVQATIQDAIYVGSSSATLSIKKASQAITFDALPDKTYGDADFLVSATAGSGLPIRFTVGDQNACTISNNIVHLTGTGSCTVIAEQAGSANYNPAPSVSHTFSIGKANAVIYLEGLNQAYDGSPKPVIVRTAPSGLSFSITYESEAYERTSAPPGQPGRYTVHVQIQDSNYQGEVTETLIIGNITLFLPYIARK